MAFAVQRKPFCEQRALSFGFLAEPRVIGNGLQSWRANQYAIAIHCSDRKLWLPGRTHFAHRHHIKRGFQPLSHPQAHGHRTPGNGQHQRLSPAVMDKRIGQTISGLPPIPIR